MRLPSGFGSVTKLSGKRRRPWMARKTLGYDEDTGSQVMQVIGYFPTRAEAITALTQYNQNPYDIDARRITFAEVYEKWSDRKFESASHPTVLAYKRSFELCSEIHKMPFCEIRVSHLQGVMDHRALNDGARAKLKQLFGQLFKYAMIHDIAEKNYAALVDSAQSSETQNPHRPFTPDEINILWNHASDTPAVSTVLIMIYTGLRVGELLDIKSADVHPDERYMTGGLKTKAGKNRIIPISRKIEPFIQDYFAKGNEYLVPSLKGKHMGYSSYISQIWSEVAALPGISEHRPHDCRHTFASLMDTAGANKLCIKRIMGHAVSDITDGVYTHKNLAELIAAIDLI